MSHGKHFLVFIITPAIPHGAFKMEVTFCVKAVYKPVRAKDSRFVLLQDSLPIIADSEFSRYKDGTRSTCALAFLKGSYGTCRSDRCPLSSFICNSLTPFHGDDAGSNPAGDAKSIVYEKHVYSLFKKGVGNLWQSAAQKVSGGPAKTFCPVHSRLQNESLVRLEQPCPQRIVVGNWEVGQKSASVRSDSSSANNITFPRRPLLARRFRILAVRTCCSNLEETLAVFSNRRMSLKEA